MSSCITVSFPGHEEWHGNEAQIYYETEPTKYGAQDVQAPTSTVAHTTVEYIHPLCSLFLPFFSPLFPSLPFLSFFNLPT